MTGRTNPYARPVGPKAAIGWGIGLFFFLAVLLMILGLLRPGAELDDVNFVLMQAASILLALYAFARIHAPNAPLREIVGARPIGFLPALLAAVIGGASVIPINALQHEILRRSPISEDTAGEITRALAALGHNERLAGAVAMVVIPPIIHELVFRGALATGLARSGGRIRALLLTAILFAVFSSGGDLRSLPVFFVAGLVLGFVRFGTGSVLGSMVAHLVWRGVDMANDLRVAHSIDPLVTATYPYPTYPIAVIAFATALVLGAGLLLVRVGRSEERDDDLPLPPAPPSAPQRLDPEDDDP